MQIWKLTSVLVNSENRSFYFDGDRIIYEFIYKLRSKYCYIPWHSQQVEPTDMDSTDTLIIDTIESLDQAINNNIEWACKATIDEGIDIEYCEKITSSIEQMKLLTISAFYPGITYGHDLDIINKLRGYYFRAVWKNHAEVLGNWVYYADETPEVICEQQMEAAANG